MNEFTPFCKTDNFKIESFIQFSRELITRDEYINLNPNAMLLYSILTDRLDLSYKQEYFDKLYANCNFNK